MGLGVEALASLAGTFARAGIDVIKDDHGLGDQAFAPFEPRVRACQAAVDDAAARTGRRAIYVPNLVGTPDRLRRQADLARAAGVSAVMMSPMLVGLPAFHELVRDGLGMPVFAHPAMGGAQRIEPVALLGRLFTVFGADAVIFPSYGGRFSYDRETCGALARALRAAAGRRRVRRCRCRPAGSRSIGSRSCSRSTAPTPRCSSAPASSPIPRASKRAAASSSRPFANRRAHRERPDP